MRRLPRAILACAVRVLPRELRDFAGHEILLDAERRVDGAPSTARAFGRWWLELLGLLATAYRGRVPDRWSRRTNRHVRSHLSPSALMLSVDDARSIAPRWSDLRHAARALSWQWRFSLGVILTLGIGIGLGVPVLGLADAYFFRTPPGIGAPDRVVRLVLRGHGTRGPYFTEGLTALDYAVMRERGRTLTDVAAWIQRRESLGVGSDARSIITTQATASFFTVLGVRPSLGRFFTAAEDHHGNPEPPSVISHGFWQRDLAGDPNVIGRRLRIGAVTYTVVGVAPPQFTGLVLGTNDVWLPLHVAAVEWQGDDPELWTTDRSAWLRIVARLAPDVSMSTATAEAEVLYRSSGERTRDREMKGSLLWESIQPGRSVIPNRNAKLALWLAGGGALLLLLIAANLATLFRVRALAASRQVAIRLAVGGSRTDLLRGFLADTLILAVAAAALGLTISVPATRVARTLLAPRMEWTQPLVDGRIALLAFGLAAGIGLIVAIGTTVTAGRTDPAGLLRAPVAAGSSASGGAARRLLLALQAAVFTVLVAGGVAFGRSLSNAVALDFGFDVDPLLSVRVPLPSTTPVEQVRRLMTDARERVGALPGVASASLGYMEPWMNNTFVPVSAPGSTGEAEQRMFDLATPEYLRTFGADLEQGRWFTEQDRQGSEPVIAINSAMAAAYFPDGRAVGNCLRLGADSMPCRTVIGVVRDFAVTGTPDDPVPPVVYVPMAQADAWPQRPTLFVRAASGSSPTALLPSVRSAVQSLDPSLPAITIRPVRWNIEWLSRPLRLGASVFMAFGLVAALVGSIGLFSVLSFMVVERRRRHAVELALGATAIRVGHSVLRFALGTTGLGVLLGVASLAPLSRLVDPLLFRTTLVAPAGILAVTVLAALLALLAAAGPLVVIHRMDVMAALRDS